MSDKKILIVTTNTSKINDEIPTGVWFEEFAVPYITFEATGYKITVASPLGGVSPVDETSYSCSNPVEWDSTKKFLDNTKKLDEVENEEFDAVFIPGGHGPMFDLPHNIKLAQILSKHYAKNKIISAVCHGPCGLISAKTPNGEPIVKDKYVTAFTNKEEQIMKRVEFMPFLLQDKLVESGAKFVEERPWVEPAEVDGNLITGQNQNSALKVAEEVIKKLGD